MNGRVSKMLRGVSNKMTALSEDEQKRAYAKLKKSWVSHPRNKRKHLAIALTSL